MSTLGFYQGLGIPSLSLKNMFLEGGEEEAKKLEKTFDVKIIEKPFWSSWAPGQLPQFSDLNFEAQRRRDQGQEQAHTKKLLK